MNQPAPRQSSIRTSRQAIAAVISAAVFFCPLTSLVGLVLGFRALRAIRASRGQLVGRKLALTAVLLSMGSFVLQLVGLSWFESRFSGIVESRVVESITGTFQQPDTAFAAHWIENRPEGVTRDAVEDLVAEAQSRYGPFQHVTLAMRPAPGDASNRLTATLTFQFERGSRVGRATVAQTIGAQRWIDFRIVNLTIEDADAGTLAVPATKALPPDAAAGEPADEKSD